MKRNELSVVVLLLFVLLPNILRAAQGGVSQHIVADNVISLSGNKQESDRQRELAPAIIDPFHQMMEKRSGNPHQWREAPRYPIRERDGMMDMGVKDPSCHAFREKRPDRKSDAANTSADTWNLYVVDAQKNFSDFYSRSIATDVHGYPHIVYGGDSLYYAYYDGNTWRYNTIDATPSVGYYTSIALDTSGNTHVSYYDWNNDDLKYATNKSGTWATTTVESEGWVGMYTSIALDKNDNAHISYYDWTNNALKYATNKTGEWITTTVDSKGYVGWYTSIALDKDGSAHISYHDDNTYNLKYATNKSGSWVATTVDSRGEVGLYTSIALDKDGNVHISYYDDTNNNLKYATNTTGIWATTAVDTKGWTGEYTSIALDKDGNVHISYYDDNTSDLRYATNTTGKWVKATVDSEGVVGWYTSVGLDKSGSVHISYFDWNNKALKYATNKTGTWVTTTVDKEGYVGMYTSMALDKDGSAHISYFDQTNNDLKYATNKTGAWVTTTVDSGGDVGMSTSIALDKDGSAHISYYDQTNIDLKYATNKTGAWVTTTVDSEGWVGMQTSLALDKEGNAHISYYDHTNIDLKYATNKTGKWVTTTVDSGGWVGRYNSIAMDKDGNAHISYWDDTNDDLKYATNKTGAWVTTTVDSGGWLGVGQYTSIAMDKDGNAHIGYYDYTSAYLKYATNKTGAWATTTVDSGGAWGAGEYTSIALDKSDNVHISYTAKYDDRTHYLKYATNKTGVWVMTTVDSDEWVGYFSSIAMDKDGNVHISYYDAGNYNLKYATNAECLPTIPQQPSPIAAVAISSSKIVLTWRDRSCNEKGFKIERKQGACSSDSNWLEITTAETTLQDTTLPEGPWTKIANVGTNIRTYTDEGLSPDTTYAYRVRAYNDIGDSDYSPCTEARTGVAGSPNSPTNLRAVSLSNNRIELSWNDTSANEKRFKIYRRMGSGKWQLNATKGKDATSHTDTNASGNAAKTTYSYYITACNSAGCSPKTNVAVVPYRPKDLKATASSSSQIDLSWIDTSANESGFRIERKDGDCSSANAWGLLATKGWNTTSYSDTELSSGATYAYRINAYIGSFARPYAIGYSAWSNCDHAKTNP